VAIYLHFVPVQVSAFILNLWSRAQTILTNRTARQAAQMTVLRFLGLGIGAAAQIYAARQLGPEQFGISGMALADSAQCSIVASLTLVTVAFTLP